MKKYKLVKIYPGSPKINSIYEKIVGPCGRESGVMYKNLNKDGACLDSLVIENEPEHWEEIIDKNPLKLEVGKEYILQYVHCKSKPQHVKITRFTKQGYPWQERVRDGGCKGIVSPDCYRLIEEVVEYPIGTKAEDNRINKTFTKEVDGWYTSSKTGHTDKSISNAKHIEVLEEVIEKDYEILSFIKDGKQILEKNEDNLFQQGIIGWGIKWLLDSIDSEIHSVKRLSDSEVFTIKDHVRPKKCNPNAFTITGFTLDCNNEHMLVLGGNGGIRIDKLNLSETPMFKTEDGVDIFEGDSFYPVNFHNLRGEEYKALKNSVNWDTSKRFSTKEAAENYINLNKPYLSINDITDYYIKWSTKLTKYSFEEGLLKLVKSKL